MHRSVKTFANEKGQVALIGLIVMGLIGFIASSIYASYEQSSLVQKRTQLLLTADNLKTQISRSLYDPQGWNQSTAGNVCLSTGLSCSSADGGPLTLKDGAGAVIINNDPAEGFNRNGERCTNNDGAFSDSGNNSCPFKYELAWHVAGCKGLPLKCQIQVTAKFKFSPRSRDAANIKMNPEHYAFDFLRGLEPDSLKSACTSSNGNFNEATGLCDNVTLTCSPNSTLVQANNGQVPTCIVTHKPETCPDLQWATGINADGTLKCVPADQVKPPCTYARTDIISACTCVGTACTENARLIWTYPNGTQCNAADTVQVCGG